MHSNKRFIESNKHGVVLACFAVVVATALAFTQHLTKDRIHTNQVVRIQNSLAEVLPDDRYDLPLDKQKIELPDSTSNKNRTIYVISKNTVPVAVIISAVAENGYSGSIEMLVGILADDTVSGVRITKHAETPGLGDAIEAQKSDWIKSFDGKSLAAPTESRWTVKKQNGDFDQFTGATITPRAVIHEVKNTLIFYQSVRQQFYQ